MLRQRRRRRGRAELPRDDRRRVAPRAAGQPRRRVLHRPGGDPAHGRPLRGRRHRRRVDRVHDVGLGVLRPAEGPALRGVEGRAHRHDAGHRRRARPPRHPRQRRPPRLDRERHDGRRADVGQVRRAQPAARADAPLGRPQPTSPASPPTSPARRASTRPATSSPSTAATTASDPSDRRPSPSSARPIDVAGRGLLLLVAGHRRRAVGEHRRPGLADDVPGAAGRRPAAGDGQRDEHRGPRVQQHRLGQRLAAGADRAGPPAAAAGPGRRDGGDRSAPRCCW